MKNKKFFKVVALILTAIVGMACPFVVLNMFNHFFVFDNPLSAIIVSTLYIFVIGAVIVVLNALFYGEEI